MNCVGLHSYGKFYGLMFGKGKVVEGNGLVYKHVIVENAFGRYVEPFKLTELRVCHRPVIGREFAASAAVIARRSISGYFHVVDEKRNVAGSVVAVVNRLRTRLERKGNGGKVSFLHEVIGKHVSNKAVVEP